MKLARPFVFGIIAAASALLVEFIFMAFFSGQPVVSENFYNQLTAPLIFAIFAEEAAKLFFIFKITQEYQARKEVIFGALAAGFGFAAIEIILIISKLTLIQSSEVLNIFGVFVIHILTAGFIGYILAVSRHAFLAGWLALVLTFTLHLIYNSLVIFNFPLADLYAFLAISTVCLYLLGKKILSGAD